MHILLHYTCYYAKNTLRLFRIESEESRLVTNNFIWVKFEVIFRSVKIHLVADNWNWETFQDHRFKILPKQKAQQRHWKQFRSCLPLSFFQTMFYWTLDGSCASAFYLLWEVFYSAATRHSGMKIFMGGSHEMYTV